MAWQLGQTQPPDDTGHLNKVGKESMAAIWQLGQARPWGLDGDIWQLEQAQPQGGGWSYMAALWQLGQAQPPDDTGHLNKGFGEGEWLELAGWSYMAAIWQLGQARPQGGPGALCKLEQARPLLELYGSWDRPGHGVWLELYGSWDRRGWGR